MTKIQIKEIKNKFVGQWLMKRTKLPFGRPARKVAFFLENFNLNGNRLYSPRTSGITYEIEKVLADLEVVPKETAEKYQQIFDSCHELSSCVSNERTHTREDGTPKRAFKPGKFAPALYSLKLKYPDYDCTAYVCPECGKIHLGKQIKKVNKTETPIMLKSTIKINEPKAERLKYPCVKIQKDNGLVVLFNSRRVGVCLQSGSLHKFPVGYFSESWLSSEDLAWSDFHGEITIKVD